MPREDTGLLRGDSVPSANRLDGCDAVLFDAVGTLMYPHPSVGAIYTHVARLWGYQVPSEVMDNAFRAAYAERFSRRFGEAGRTSDATEKAWWRETVARNFELAGLAVPSEPCFEAIFARFGESRSWGLFGDALPTLLRLRRSGRRAGIVSNFDSRLEALCHGLGLSEAVDAVVYSAAVGFAKPARPIFAAALQALETSPERTLFVGDSPQDDVAGARAAGCRAMLLDRRTIAGSPDTLVTLADLLDT